MHAGSEQDRSAPPPSRCAPLLGQYRPSSRCALATLVLCLFGTPAFAQSPGGGFPGTGGNRSPMRQNLPSDDTKCPAAKLGPSLADRFNVELDASRVALELKAEQMSAWGRFESSSKKALRDLTRGEQPHTVSLSEMLAPQLIDQALDDPRDRLTALEDVGDSAKALYQDLTPDQRRIADSRLPKLVRLLAGGP